MATTDNSGFYCNEYRGITTAVLGATGFIGQWVARELSRRGANVHLIVRDKKAAHSVFGAHINPEHIWEVDLLHLKTTQKLFHQIKPSITFNLAGYGIDRTESDESTADEINAKLVKRMCEDVSEIRDSRWVGQDIVHVGSALEYGDIFGDLNERSVPQPTTLYGKSKLAGTQALTQCCRSYGIKGLTARLFTVYGPGEHEARLLPSLISAAKTERLLPLTAGRQKRDFTFITDVVEGLLRLGLSNTKPGEVVNVATGKLTSVRVFAETAAKELKIPLERLRFGALPTRTDEMDHAEVSLAVLRRALGWVPPTSVTEGIRQTVRWARA